jgi:hypothetical protein
MFSVTRSAEISKFGQIILQKLVPTYKDTNLIHFFESLIIYKKTIFAKYIHRENFGVTFLPVWSYFTKNSVHAVYVSHMES